MPKLVTIYILYMHIDMLKILIWWSVDFHWLFWKQKSMNLFLKKKKKYDYTCYMELPLAFCNIFIAHSAFSIFKKERRYNIILPTDLCHLNLLLNAFKYYFIAWWSSQRVYYEIICSMYRHFKKRECQGRL